MSFLRGGGTLRNTALLWWKKSKNEILMGAGFVLDSARAAACRKRIPAVASALIRKVGGFAGILASFNFHRGKQLLNFIEHS